MTRSGFVALAGRPNAGKSTITNHLVGQKVTIVSNRPQTTRRAIRGVVTREDAQLVMTDLPGVQRPLDRLTGRMQRRVERELTETDAVLLVLNGYEGVGPGDRFIASLLRDRGAPVVAAVNKIDRMGPASLAEVLSQVGGLDLARAIVPVSARTGEGMTTLFAELAKLVPEGPLMFPPDATTDQALPVQIAELVREQVISRTRQELPHSVEVEIEEITTLPSGLTEVRALILVDSESQKGIVVGRGGQMIRNVGTAARKEIGTLLGGKVHLELRVRTRRGWREDDALLDRLGLD